MELIYLISCTTPINYFMIRQTVILISGKKLFL